MGHYTEGRHWNDKTKAWEFDEPPEAGLSSSNALLADDLQISVKIEQSRSPATDEYESYLVIRAKGKTQPYLYIPDSFDDEVLDAIIDRVKTGNGKSH